jgi:acetylornithine/N-succinyldiaminopimelate aminotransferase
MDKHADNVLDQKLKQAKESILFTAARPEAVMERGEGMYLWDTAGNKYLDFMGGWAVTSLGHSPSTVKDALAKQASTLVHASPAFYNKPMLEFAALLTEISCFDKVFFTSSGAEANESAIKLARKYGQKHLNGAYEIITMEGGFHGRTLATMSATGKPQWESLYAPKVPGFKHIPLNDEQTLMKAVTGNTCAIMLELVQGEGGVHPVHADYLHRIREICDENGLLLIIDEIQTGIGRTGKMFAYQHYGIEADVMTLGKGIGCGFPLSAMLTKTKFDLFEAGDQGGTYTGQPLAMAVGLSVVKEVMDRGLHHHAGVQGKYILERLQQLADLYPIRQIRGMGLLLAFDLPKPNGKELAAKCFEQGLLINSAGSQTVRLMPPLVVSKEDTESMLSTLFHVMGTL